MTVLMHDADFGLIPTATNVEDIPEAPSGFERIAIVADNAMVEVLREDWALAEYESTSSS